MTPTFCQYAVHPYEIASPTLKSCAGVQPPEGGGGGVAPGGGVGGGCVIVRPFGGDRGSQRAAGGVLEQLP
jgi:hypothetical protein